MNNWQKFLISDAVVNIKNADEFNRLMEFCEQKGIDTYIVKKMGFDRIHFSASTRKIEEGNACVEHQYGRGLTFASRESFERHYEILTIDELFN